MSKLIAVLIILLLGWAGWKFAEYYQTRMDSSKETEVPWLPPPEEEEAAELPPALERSYQEAKSKGARELKRWLDAWRASVPEPRRTEIDLDYVEILAVTDPPAAQRAFAAIRKRPAPDERIRKRIEGLARLLE